MDVADDVNCIRRAAEAEDLGIEANGDVDLVSAGEEEQGVARGAKLAVLLLRVDLVDARLDVRGRG